MRTLLYALFLLLGVFFIFTNLSQVETVIDTFQRGQSRWLILGGLLELVWIVNIAALYRAVYRLLDVDVPLRRLLYVVAAAKFTEVLASALASIAVFIDDARRHGLRTGRIALAALLTVWVEYMAYIAVIALGFTVLIRRNSLGIAEITTGLILVAIATAFGGLILLGVSSTRQLEQVLIWGVQRVNKIVSVFRRNYLSEEIAHQFAGDTATAFERLRSSAASLWLPFALAFSARALHLSIFFLMFLAFQQPYSPGTLIAGYSIASLFTIVSVTPGGLAIVEGVMVVTLRSLRVPLASATVITLAYRGLTFWLPFGIGFLALRLHNRSHSREAAA